MVAYFERFSLIKSHNPLNTLSREITKLIKSQLSQCLWSPNFAGWWHITGSSHPCSFNPLFMWSCEVTWQIECYISIFRHMGTNLVKVVTYHEKLQPIKSHDLMFVTWQTGKIFISTFTRLISTKIDRLLTKCLNRHRNVYFQRTPGCKTCGVTIYITIYNNGVIQVNCCNLKSTCV